MLNASKTKVLIFRHQNKPIMYRKKPEDKLSMWNITIKIDGKKIEPSSHVNWNFHIDELSTKLSRAVGMLAKIRHYKREDTFHGLSWNFFIPTSIWFSNLGTK